jgi:hypothetical protein
MHIFRTEIDPAPLTVASSIRRGLQGLAAAAILILLGMVPVQALASHDCNAPGNLVANCGFETGDFSGWITQDLTVPFYPLSVGGAGLSPGLGLFTSAPTEGIVAALHGFDGNGPGTIEIAQDVVIPSYGQPELLFDYRAGWDMLSFGGSTQDRTFEVVVETGGGAPLQTDGILTAVAGTVNLDTGNLEGTVDLSAFKGMVIRIKFVWTVPENLTGPAFFQLDNVLIAPPAWSGSQTPCCNDGLGAPGCIDPTIEMSICDVDPFCCDSSWDGICVDEVTSIFGDNCDCSLPSTDAEGCFDPVLGNAVSDAVCAIAPSCCTVVWDNACVLLVPPPPPPPSALTFSIDFQGPMIGVPDSFSGSPITDGDILTPSLPGPPGPNLPLVGPLPPPGTEVGAFPGAPGVFPGGLGIVPGIFGCVELDALSYGRDVLTADSIGVFSVDEFASGVPVLVGPDVFSEGVFGASEASADVFSYLGPITPTPPGPPFGNAAFIDGDGFVPSGAPGLGLFEPNPPTVGSIPDPGDNLDALDLETTAADLAGPIYFSLDASFPDPLELSHPMNCGTAVGNGFSGADVLVSFAGGLPGLAIPGALLGLDLVGFDTDDLDALLWDDADGSGTLTAVDSIAFSVRRGSAVIGSPDSLFGVPIEEGDLLTPPPALGLPPAIFIAAENAGLGTLRSGTAGPFGADDVDAIDLPEPGFGLGLVVGLAFMVTVGRRRMKM